MGKNQVEMKDNHGHITKVHRRDVKKIPMTEKVSKMYEEEQAGKNREGRKAVPNSKMPDLGWDIAETQLTLEAQKENNSNTTPLLRTLVTVIVLIIAIVKQTTAGIKKVMQVIEASHNRITENIRDFHKNVTSAITIVTNTTVCTNHKEQARINKKILPKHVKTQRRVVPVDHSQDLQSLRQLIRPVAAQVSAYFM